MRVCIVALGVLVISLSCSAASVKEDVRIMKRLEYMLKKIKRQESAEADWCADYVQSAEKWECNVQNTKESCPTTCAGVGWTGADSCLNTAGYCYSDSFVAGRECSSDTPVCCEACANAETGNADCPYGDSVEWCAEESDNCDVFDEVDLAACCSTCG